MKAPAHVQRAFDHVKSIFPEVVMVMYTPTMKWMYIDEDGEAPAFNDQVDVSLLEDAVDSLDTFPCIFHFDEFPWQEGSRFRNRVTVEDTDSNRNVTITAPGHEWILVITNLEYGSFNLYCEKKNTLYFPSVQQLRQEFEYIDCP